jgi:predicted dehydrogenase
MVSWFTETDPFQNDKPMKKILLLKILVLLGACSPSVDNGNQNRESMPLRLITLDPGHFHAALVQKKMYAELDSLVQVYAPEGKDVEQHLQRIDQYNQEVENPTAWEEKVYLGEDYLQKMQQDQSGDIVVLAGKNDRKIDYIRKSIAAGLHVLADKPMVIRAEDYQQLEKAFNEAEAENLVLYDIMTERYQILNILQNELMAMPDIFGDLQKGSPEEPAIVKQSVHHFYKTVSGKPLVRPAWYFDVEQQGEGIVDVTTHFVDLILWSVFPEQMISSEQVSILQAERWPTAISDSHFQQVSGMDHFPAYLHAALDQDSVLQVYSNGAFVFSMHDIHAKISVVWNFQAPDGGGDTHLSIFRGSRSNLAIRQGEEQHFKPVLYVEKKEPEAALPTEAQMRRAMEMLEKKYPGVSFLPADTGWEISVPEAYLPGHEAHFAKVMEKYLGFVKSAKLPEWEKQAMLVKYWITTQAYKKSRQENPMAKASE